MYSASDLFKFFCICSNKSTLVCFTSSAIVYFSISTYVIPEDVRAVCHDVLRHRIGLTYEAEANNITADEIISEILDKVEVP